MIGVVQFLLTKNISIHLLYSERYSMESITERERNSETGKGKGNNTFPEDNAYIFSSSTAPTRQHAERRVDTCHMYRIYRIYIHVYRIRIMYVVGII